MPTFRIASDVRLPRAGKREFRYDHNIGLPMATGSE
jgi:hypothetical protein